MKRTSALAAAACSLALMACGTDQPALEGTAPPALTSPSPTPAAPQAECELAEGGDDTARMFLTDVTVDVGTTSDTVVFTFEPPEDQEAAVPYYKIEPRTPPLTEDPTGRELEVAGDAFLEVIIWASGVDLGPDKARETYTGPNTIEPTGSAIVEELREGGDFENVLTWFAGLTQEGCFRVETTDDPVRIAIDIEPAA